MTTTEKDRRSPAPDDGEPDEGAYEDAWYRTMKVRAERRSADEATDPATPESDDTDPE